MLKKFLTILLGASLFLVACNKKEVSTENKPVKEELVVAREGESKTLDPHQGNDGYSLQANRLIYSRLVEADGDMKIHPGLAESWEQIDDRTTQFKLRKGVKFHNGDPLTAEDVKFSLERMTQSPRIAFVVPPIERVDIIDENTINIVTKTPFGPLLAHLAHPALGIVSKKVVTEAGENYASNPVGTGSYKFKEWINGDRLVFEKNEEFFDKNEKGPKTIIFKPVVEESSRLIGLETGEYDVAFALYGLNEEAVKKSDKLELHAKPSLSTIFLGMNNEKEPFNNPKVRKAISYAIAKQSIIDTVLNGSGIIPNAPVVSAVFGSTDKTKNYDYNVEKAKELLKEAGYENGFDTSIVLRGGDINQQTAEIIQANLRDIGINAKIEILESSAFLDFTANGNHDMYLGAWGVVTGDADYGLYSLYHSSAKGATGNRDFYSNPEVDKYIEEARKEINPEKRKELYEKAEILIMEDVPNVLLFSRFITVASQKNVKGINVHPVTLHNMATAYFE